MIVVNGMAISSMPVLWHCFRCPLGDHLQENADLKTRRRLERDAGNYWC